MPEDKTVQKSDLSLLEMDVHGSLTESDVAYVLVKWKDAEDHVEQYSVLRLDGDY